MARMHHEKFRIDKGTYLLFVEWCGRRGMTENFTREPELQGEGEEILEPMSPEELRNPKNHCCKCLKAKQQTKGEDYMRENGYPVWDKKTRKWK